MLSSESWAYSWHKQNRSQQATQKEVLAPSLEMTTKASCLRSSIIPRLVLFMTSSTRINERSPIPRTGSTENMEWCIHWLHHDNDMCILHRIPPCQVGTTIVTRLFFFFSFLVSDRFDWFSKQKLRMKNDVCPHEKELNLVCDTLGHLLRKSCRSSCALFKIAIDICYLVAIDNILIFLKSFLIHMPISSFSFHLSFQLEKFWRGTVQILVTWQVWNFRFSHYRLRLKTYEITLFPCQLVNGLFIARCGQPRNESESTHSNTSSTLPT